MVQLQATKLNIKLNDFTISFKVHHESKLSTKDKVPTKLIYNLLQQQLNINKLQVVKKKYK